jgi:hypothetical protein
LHHLLLELKQGLHLGIELGRDLVFNACSFLLHALADLQPVEGARRHGTETNDYCIKIPVLVKKHPSFNLLHSRKTVGMNIDWRHDVP